MNKQDIVDMIVDALQADLEQGSPDLSEKAEEEFRKRYPHLAKAISDAVDEVEEEETEEEV